jgi:acyl transferase domain-containing protein
MWTPFVTTVPAGLDSAGRRRSPATLRGSTRDSRRNKGLRYPAGPSMVQEIVAAMREAGADPEALACVSR